MESNKVPITYMFGPRFTRNRWRIDYRELGGKRRTRTFTSIESAEKWKEENSSDLPPSTCLQAPIAQVPEDTLIRSMPDFDGTLNWYMQILGKITKEVYLYGDPNRRNDLKSIASAGIAAKHLFDNTKLEGQVKELLDRTDEIARARKHGIRIIGSDASITGTSEPKAQVG